MIAESGATWVFHFGVKGIALWYSLTGGPDLTTLPGGSERAWLIDNGLWCG